MTLSPSRRARLELLRASVRDAEVVVAYCEGATLREIAGALEASPETVRSWLIRKGVDVRSRGTRTTDSDKVTR